MGETGAGGGRGGTGDDGSGRGPWSGAWSQLAALVLPVSCAGCGRADVPWCADCADALLGPGAGEVAGPRLPSLTGAAAPWGAAAYAGPVRELLVAWKEHGRHDLTALLADALAPAVTGAWEAAGGGRARAGGRGALLVPVPSSRGAARRRGGPLVAELAVATARRLTRSGVSLTAPPPGRALLALVRAPRDQAGLGAGERATNLRGAHRADARLAGRACLLVDDITTTGATLGEAARAVGAVGGLLLGAATVAATPRRTPDGPVALAGPGPPH